MEMEALLSGALMAALSLSLMLQAAATARWDERAALRTPSYWALALGILFLALESSIAREAPGEWAFRYFHASLCLASFAASNWFLLAEIRRAS